MTARTLCCSIVLAGIVVAMTACDDEGGGPGVTSSTERVEGTLPLTSMQCFTQELLDVNPDIAGDQFECSALLDGELLPECDNNGGGVEPCWRIVATSSSPMCHVAPDVSGGNDGQTLSIECVTDDTPGF
jgi:hypothetical protein